jgi:hypothetical protein
VGDTTGQSTLRATIVQNVANCFDPVQEPPRIVGEPWGKKDDSDDDPAAFGGDPGTTAPRKSIQSPPTGSLLYVRVRCDHNTALEMSNAIFFVGCDDLTGRPGRCCTEG